MSCLASFRGARRAEVDCGTNGAGGAGTCQSQAEGAPAEQAPASQTRRAPAAKRAPASQTQRGAGRARTSLAHGAG
jgi:hypothetical protein